MSGRYVLLLAAAAYETDPEGPGVDAGLVLRAAVAAGLGADALDAAERAGLRRGPDGRLRLPGRRRLYEATRPERRRAAHRLLAAAATGSAALLHRLLGAAYPDAGLGARLAAAEGAPHGERATALAHAARLADDPTVRAERLIAAANHARLAGRPHRARELLGQVGEMANPDAVRACAAWGCAGVVLDSVRGCAASVSDSVQGCARLVPGSVRGCAVAVPDSVRGCAGAVPDGGRGCVVFAAERLRGRGALVRGLLALRDGPVADARESLLLAAHLCAEPASLEARLGAAEASWAMGDADGYLQAAGSAGGPWGAGARSCGPDDAAAGDGGRGLAESSARSALDYRVGMAASLGERAGVGRVALRRVVARSAGAREPGALLLAGAAALVAGDVDAACRLGSRALAAARDRDAGAELPRTLELLAYGELRSGRHARARAHAEEGVRAALAAGQRNVLAHQHAVLALVASLDGDVHTVARHAAAAQDIAGPHGLVQAATLAQWALARADLARGDAARAAARLGPLIGPGPRCGHFAVRMLAVPCLVEAAVLAGRPDGARAAVGEFTVWVERGHDPLAPAQLARCQALLAWDDPPTAESRFDEALDRHEHAGGDFERARTLALYGKWLRRTRRPARARALLRDALVAFERCGASVWAEQAAAELRATGESPDDAEPPGRLAELTPQQLRIARCVAKGDTNREVARRLSVSPRTVDHHLRNVFDRLGVRSRVELTRLVDRTEVAGRP
ncbi:LuxR C-terminal-related transcriptional regulator [Streptomyces sp. NPDC102360]|uniref:helix-turn-helix transcriptional regulator n=1 Tax=Streptomyces sp. NPDC102360 TaxID=3366160 RepID=UPI0038260615